jgi:hypothetical protein
LLHCPPQQYEQTHFIRKVGGSSLNSEACSLKPAA